MVISVAPTVTQPVFPALTKASPSPSLSNLKPTAIDESDFSLSTHFASSCIEITEFELTIFVLLSAMLLSLAHFFITSSLPTRTGLIPYSFTARKVPLSISSGALSPPIASIIILLIFGNIFHPFFIFKAF